MHGAERNSIDKLYWQALPRTSSPGFLYFSRCNRLFTKPLGGLVDDLDLPVHFGINQLCMVQRNSIVECGSVHEFRLKSGKVLYKILRLVAPTFQVMISVYG